MSGRTGVQRPPGRLRAARVWFDALAVWAIVLVLAGVRLVGPGRPGLGLWSVAAVLVAYAVVLGFVRALCPVRTRAGNPRVLLAGGRSWAVGTVTGIAGPAGESDPARPVIPAPRRPLDGRGRERRLVRDRLRLRAADGSARDVRVRHALVAVGEGDLVTVARASRPGRPDRELAVVNHSLGTTAWLVRAGLGPIVLGGRPVLTVGWMVLDNVLFLAGGAWVGIVLFGAEVLLLAVIVRAQVAWFRARTSAPLMAVFRAEAARGPGRRPGPR